MNRKFFTLAIALTCAILYTASCTRDQVELPEPCDEVKSYNDAIREILRNNCNLSGCHDGASGVGNYNSYDAVKRVVELGEFRQEVVIERTMPKNGVLTTEEYNLLRCWSENGFPEN
jgi:hypothetical protein